MDMMRELYPEDMLEEGTRVLVYNVPHKGEPIKALMGRVRHTCYEERKYGIDLDCGVRLYQVSECRVKKSAVVTVTGRHP